MVDELDRSQERTQHNTDRQVEQIRKEAGQIPVGEPGNCELCGEWSGRLVVGVCAPCRDKHGLP